jgi:hypothetical protein
MLLVSLSLDIPRPTTQVVTRTDYSVGLWEARTTRLVLRGTYWRGALGL